MECGCSRWLNQNEAFNRRGRLESFKFDRNFQLWSYSAGHGELILRSAKTIDHPKRIDILFRDVMALELIVQMDNLSIEEARREPSNSKRLPGQGVMVQTFHKRYVLKAGVWSGYIRAGSIFVHEDDGEYGQPSYFQTKNPLFKAE